MQTNDAESSTDVRFSLHYNYFHSIHLINITVVLVVKLGKVSFFVIFIAEKR